MAAKRKKKGPTKKERVLKELEEAARALGLNISYSDLKFAGLNLTGGRCTFKGEPWLVLGRRQTYAEKLELLGEALDEYDLNGLELSPEAARALGLNRPLAPKE